MVTNKSKTPTTTKVNQEDKKSTGLQSSRYKSDEYAKMSDGMVP